jgi:hypothetical protein
MAEPATPAATNGAAPVAPEAAAEPASAENSGIDAALAELSDEDLAGNIIGVDTEGDADPEQPETPEAEDAEPADPTKGLDDEVIFSDKALTTKEGVLRAKARIGQLRKLTHEKYQELKHFERRVVKRHTKLQHAVKEHVADKRSVSLLANNMQSIADNGLSGDPERMVHALGSLYGMDGVKALEMVNSVLIHKGRTPMDPQIQSVIDGLRQEVEQLKGGITQQQAQARVGQLKQKNEQHEQRIGQHITQSATEMPHLARIYAGNPEGTIEHIVDEVTAAHEEFKAGRRARPLDMRTYLVNLEAQLAPHFNGGQAPQGVGGGPAPKQPASAQRSPGQSIGPRSTAASTPRVPSADEALRALADDEALMSSLGLG